MRIYRAMHAKLAKASPRPCFAIFARVISFQIVKPNLGENFECFWSILNSPTGIHWLDNGAELSIFKRH